MSKQYICDVNYHFTGIDETNRRDRELRDKMKKWYMELRDQLVEKTNPMIDTWNAEFDRIYGKIDLSKDPKMSRVYEEFMKDKFDPIMEEFDNTVAKHFGMRYEPDKDFVGIYERRRGRNKKVTVYITLSNIIEA